MRAGRPSFRRCYQGRKRYLAGYHRRDARVAGTRKRRERWPRRRSARPKTRMFTHRAQGKDDQLPSTQLLSITQALDNPLDHLMSGTITASDDHPDSTGISGQQIFANPSCVSHTVCWMMQVWDVEMGQEGEDVVFDDCVVQAISIKEGVVLSDCSHSGA